MEQEQYVERSPTLSTRQRMFVNGLADGPNQTQAAKAAGYSCAHVQGSLLLKRPQIQRALRAAMESQGLTDDYLAAKLRELCEAVSMDDKGNVNPNWPARSRGVDILCRMKGAYRDSSLEAELTFEERLIRFDAGKDY